MMSVWRLTLGLRQDQPVNRGWPSGLMAAASMPARIILM